jgi:hypothetical protein
MFVMAISQKVRYLLPRFRSAELVEAPAGWAVMRVEDLYEQLPVGKRWDSKTALNSGAVPIIDQSADGILGFHDEDPGINASDQWPVVTFANHTCAMRVMKQPFSVIQNVFPMVGRAGVCDTRFLYYATNGRIESGEYKGHHPTWRSGYLPLPPIAPQQKIVSILSAYDELIENNARRIEILEEMAQAIYREWFVDFRYPGHEDVPLVDSELGPIPEGWAVSNLGSVCTRVQAGGTPSRKNSEFWDDGVINWFRTTELQDGFLFDSSEKISHAGLEGSSAKMFEAGSILMAIYGSPTVGRLGILTRDATCNQAALALVPDETVISHPFLYQTLTSMREHFNSIAQGAAQQNISKATVAGTLMMLPPRPLVDLYDQMAVPMWDLTRTLTEELGNLRETRDLLLPRLISGEIDVSELEIELADSSV